MWAFAGEVLKLYGLPGLVLVGILALYYLKDRELKAERDARIADAKAQTEVMIAVSDKQHDGIAKLSTIMEAWQAREAASELAELKARAEVAERRASRSPESREPQIPTHRPRGGGFPR
jgi:hypothetical protein